MLLSVRVYVCVCIIEAGHRAMLEVEFFCNKADGRKTFFIVSASHLEHCTISKAAQRFPQDGGGRLGGEAAK